MFTLYHAAIQVQLYHPTAQLRSYVHQLLADENPPWLEVFHVYFDIQYNRSIDPK